MTDQVFIKPNPPGVLVNNLTVRDLADAVTERALTDIADAFPTQEPRRGDSITDLQEQVAMLNDLIIQHMAHIERLEGRQAEMRQHIESLRKDMSQVAEMLPRYTQSIAALRDEADHVEGFIAGHKKVHEERGLTGKWNFRARPPKS